MPTESAASGVIQAAGGLLWRDTAQGKELAVIHRARYDDWTLPKGKLKPAETWQEAALREVKEETGCTARLESFAGSISYLVNDVPKVVLFWHMALVGDCDFQPSEEVDKVVWLPAPEALQRLNYAAERAILINSRPLPRQSTRWPGFWKGREISQGHAFGVPDRSGETQTLIVGYGNPDREDDGVAWHILTRLAQRLSLPEPAGDAEALADLETSPHLLCLLQLNPELAELVAEYERVCFVDAHTGAYPEDIRCEMIEGEYLPSPFTHHMTPPTLLMLAQTLYGRAPRALVVSVRGYQFGFSDQLSPATAALTEAAVQRILTWVQS